ncbi:hypothetical protein [Sphingomonas swuensis]|uniref:hypothetical protein n=1 Tax=Sphingomonas swuensis TaxID=977800 RepID=UPI003CD074EF
MHQHLWPALAILFFVTAQRLLELVLARKNTAGLLAIGAKEYAPGHYPLIVAVHATWLAALFWLAPGRPIHWPLLMVFVLLQLGRVWVLRTLGPLDHPDHRPSRRSAGRGRAVSLRLASQLPGGHRGDCSAPAGVRPVAGGGGLLGPQRAGVVDPDPGRKSRARRSCLMPGLRL